MARHSDPLDSTIDALLNIGDMKEVRAILQQTPILLSAEGLERIHVRADEARAAGSRSLAQMLDSLAALVGDMKLKENFPSIELLAAVDELLHAKSWDDSHRIIQEHPELLSDDADALLVARAEHADSNGNGGDPYFIEENRRLLMRCREIGVEAAFAEKTQVSETVYEFVQAATWEEARDILEQHPELLTDQVDEVMRHIAEDARLNGEPEAASFIDENRELLRRSREVGVEAAFEELSGSASSELLATLDIFLEAPTWKESQQALREHPELLSAETDDLLERLIQVAQAEHDQEGADFFTGRRHLLRLVRRVGMDAAFADMSSEE